MVQGLANLGRGIGSIGRRSTETCITRRKEEAQKTVLSNINKYTLSLWQILSKALVY